MSFLKRQADPLDVTPYQGRAEPYSTPTEIFNSAVQFMQYNQQAYSERTQYRSVFAPIIEEIQEKTGRKFHNPAGYLGNTSQEGAGYEMFQYRAEEIFQHVRDNQDQFPELQNFNMDFVKEQGRVLAQQSEEEYNAVKSRARDFGFFSKEGAAEFGAGMLNFAADPAGQTALAIPGAQLPKLGPGFVKQLGKFLALEFANGAGTEAVIQAGVKDWYDSQGKEYTFEQYWDNVLKGGLYNIAGSAGLQGTFRGAKKATSGINQALGLTYKQSKELINILKRGRAPKTQEVETGLKILEDMEETIQANPLVDPIDVAAIDADIAALNKQFDDLVLVEQKAIEDQLDALQKEMEDLADQGLSSEKIVAQIGPRQKDLKDQLAKINSRKDAIGLEVERLNKSKQVGTADDIGPAQSEHIERVEAAQQALEFDEVVTTPDVPRSPVKAPETIYEAEERAGIPRLDIDKIQVDADTFQFKSGGDKFGVTEKLQGETIWNPYYAGTVTVWERADGVQFIADGHQRLGLAKRIKAADPNQDVALYGHVFREADGYSASKVRVLAAMNNVANNTADALDIAKILKEAPEMASQLPKYSAAGRQGRDLVNLAIENWGYVYNKIVPANYASIVSRLIPEADKQLQEAALKILAKSNPTNEVQAEAIIRQVRDIEADTVVQESLFGEEVFKESLFIERADVLDRALKQLKLDKRSFKNLVDQEERLEAEGNKLASDANKKRADIDGKAIEYINILANKKGEVSDALTDAARIAKDTGRVAEAARGFADYVRGRIDDGSFTGFDDVGVGRYVDDTPEKQRVQDAPEQELIDFSDITQGKGFQDQLNALEDLEMPMSARKEREMIERGEIAPNYKYYLTLPEGAIEIPTQNIKPIRARPDGIAKGRELMAEAAKGGMSKRGPLSVRDDGDGTYTLLDGNSTYAIASEAGMPTLPARVLTMEEFAREEAMKAASKILKADGKPKRRRVNANDMGKEEFEEFFLTLRLNQGFDNLEEMLAVGDTKNTLLNDIVQGIADDMGLEMHRAPVKKMDRALEKVEGKYRGRVNMLSDVARTAVTITDPAQIDVILKRLASPDLYHVIYEDFRMTSEGYFDAKASLIDKDGFVKEIQFYPPGMLKAKTSKDKGGDGGHDLYAISRDKANNPIEVRYQAIQDQLELYGSVQAALPESFSDLIGRLPKSAPLTFAEMVASEKLISGERISRSISEGEIGSQELVSLNQAYASELSSDIAASNKPSTLNQRMGDTSGQSIDVASSERKSTMTLDGDQLVIPGAEQISQRELAERIMESAKRGGYEPLPEGGLFDEVRTKDLFDEFDDDMKFSYEHELPDGELVYQERTVKQMREEFNQDQSMLDRLRGCVK